MPVAPAATDTVKPEYPALSYATLLRKRQARADARAAARCRVDLDLSAGKRDALLHAEQALASSLNGALARGGHIEATTVIAHHELQGTVGLAELYLDTVRLGVAEDIGQRLLTDAEAGHLHGGWRPLPEGS